MSKFVKSIEDQIKQIFPADLFSITINDEDVSIRTKNPETKFCLTLTFEEDDIFISMLKNVV